MIPEPVDALRSTFIWKTLANVSPSYANKAIKFVETVAPILDTISYHFPYYTSHDAEHSKNILNRYKDILKPSCFEKDTDYTLTDVELFLLICSAYAHDIGMTVFPNEKEPLLKELMISDIEGWETNLVLQKHLRDNHSTRGYKFISENASILEFPINLLSYLDSLMKAHNLTTSELKQDLLNKYAANNSILPLTQLSSILCVADALEFSDTRVKESVLYQLKERITEEQGIEILRSYNENMKHVCIGSNLAIDNNGEIIVNGTFHDSEVLNLAHRTFDDIEAWIRGYLEIDSHFPKSRLRIRNHSIYRTLVYPGGDFERLGVRLKKDNIIKLISSNSVWTGNPAFVIKELLQNSVEACRYRKHNTPESENYNPTVEVVFDKKEHTITINDNGCGMSRDVVLDNFLTVGNSRSFHPDYQKNDHVSLARFGIGFWSVFTIAKIAQISTTNYLNNNNEGIEFTVSIQQFKDYILLKKANRGAGTTIKLAVNNEINLYNIYAKVFDEIICSKIPIVIKYGDEVKLIPSSPEVKDDSELFGPKLPYAKSVNVALYHKSYNDSQYEFDMSIAYRKIDKNITFLLANGTSVFSLKSTIGNSANSALCGFKVNTLPVFTPYQANAITSVCANILSPKGFVFNLNRTTLIPTEEVDAFNDTLSRFLTESYYKFLQDNDMLGIEDIYRLFKEGQMGINGGIGTSKKQIDYVINNFPELIVFKLFKIEAGKNINTCEIQYFNISQIINLDIKVVSFNGYHNHMFTFNIRESDSNIIYDILSSMPVFQNCYFHEANGFYNLLFDRSKESHIHAIKFDYRGEFLLFPIMSVVANSVKVDEDGTGFIKYINSGTKWAGSVYIKKVIGSKYSLANHSIYINPETKLASDVNSLIAADEILKLAEILNLLAFAESGHVHDSIKEYL